MNVYERKRMEERIDEEGYVEKDKKEDEDMVMIKK